MARRMTLLSTGATLTVILFLSFFDNFTQIPMIAPYAASLGAGAIMTGWIVSIYSVANTVGNIAAGVVLDKFGRRIPLAIGLVWAGAGVFLYGVVDSPAGLLGARAFHGLGGSILVPAIFAMTADTTSSDQRSRGMARIGAMIGIAAIIGPMVSGILRQAWGPQGVFTTVFVVMALGSLLALTLPETLSSKAKPGERKPDAARATFAAPGFHMLNLAGFGAAAGLGALTYLIPLQLEQQGLTAARSSSVFSIFAIVAVIFMMNVGRRGFRSSTFATGFVAIAAAFSVLSAGATFGIAALGMALFGIGFGLLYPSLNTQVAAMFPSDERGRAYGIFNAFYTLGVVVAPPLIGWVLGFASTAVVFGSIAALALAGAAALYVFRHTMDVEPEKEPVSPAAV